MNKINWKNFILLISVNIVTPSVGQVYPDQYWLLGAHESIPQPGANNAVLFFDDTGLSVAETDMHINIESTVATMVDSTGRLLFYSNGCFIANANGELMENGDGLNPGEMHDWTCESAGYTAPFGAVALASPAGDKLYYLLHIGVNYSPEHRLSYGPFYYTVIDMKANNGLGRVISKNNLLIGQRTLAPFSVARHGNGRDWWIIVPEYGTNTYFKFLLSNVGVTDVAPQQLGAAMSCRYIGTGAFALQGHRYARQDHCGLYTFDFDRCSGLLSNSRFFSFAPQAFGGGGVVFTPDGNSVLTTTQLAVLRVDLTESTPSLDTVIHFPAITGTSLHLMQYGSDGRLYFSTLGRGAWYHVIENPNTIDEDSDFEIRGQPLPVRNIRSLPNFPNYRLFDWADSPCDTLGITVSAISSHKEIDGDYFFAPNPAKDYTIFHYPEHWDIIDMAMYNIQGNIMNVACFGIETGLIKIDLSLLPEGIYNCRFVSASGKVITQSLLVIK